MNPKTRNSFAGMALLLIGLSLILAVNLTAPRAARANPGVLYAAPAAQGSGNCTSWANACTLQTALAQAVSGDEIWVKAGVHYPGAAGNRTATFTLKNGVALYGGFAGTEASRDERNWQANKTILSGDIDRNDITDLNGVVTTTANIRGSNVYHVVTISGTNNTAVLDGFIITAGQANGSSSPHNEGGGVYKYESNLTLTNVTFSGNSATRRGGGMYNYRGNATLTNVNFSGNSAVSSLYYCSPCGGGGIYSDRSSPTLTNVTFSSNTADDGGGMYGAGRLTDVTFSNNSARCGGGMYNNGNSTLMNVTFSGNRATSMGGGGMYNYGDSTLTNVTFSGNTASTYHGGGMFNSLSSPTLTNVTFSGNSADYTGGGMYNNQESKPKLTNVTFSGNSAQSGGGMSNDMSHPTLTNVTFSGNSAQRGGGMSNDRSSTPNLTNVVFSGNSATTGGGMYNSDSSPKLTNVSFGNNSATEWGGGMYNVCRESCSTRPPILITNVIVWGNNAPSSAGIYNSNITPTISYSDIQGCGGSGNWNSACGTNGGNNIDADPLFVDAAAGNLRLQSPSPAIDAGSNTAVPPGVTTDLDGNPRIEYIVDMGAYEYQAGPGPRPFGKAVPLNGDAFQPLPLTLLWNASALANAYAYCYDTTDNNACDSTWVTTTQTSAQISGLGQGSTYYWQVRAVNNEGDEEADGGIWWSFTTAPSRPGLFRKISPANGTVRTPVVITLSWTASAGVGQYEYCYDTTNDNACTPWLSAGTGVSVTLSNLLQGTTYYWQVRATNTYGTTYANGSSTDFWSFATQRLPGAFNKSSPADGSSLPPNKNVTLSWSASSEVDTYEYCYDTTDDNACTPWVSAGANTSVTLSGLNPNTTYYWQVRARNIIGVTYANGSDLHYWRFTTDRLPGAFNKISPADGIDQPSTVTLSWGVSSDADAYEYCYDTTNDNACSEWRSAGTDTSVTLYDLIPGATYYWQVRARNAAGITYADGSSTAFRSFRVNLVRWTGTNATFWTDLARTQWNTFRLTFQYYSFCTGASRTAEIQVDESGPISNNQFGSSGSTFSFSGQFTSSSTAAGTYDIRGHAVWVPLPGGGGCFDFVTQSGIWNATRVLLRPWAFGKAEPANGATNQDTTLSLRWNPSTDATGYQYCLDTTNNGACDTSWVSAGANLSADLTGLAEGTTYYWQVRASNSVGVTEADNGVWWSFTTQGVRRIFLPLVLRN